MKRAHRRLRRCRANRPMIRAVAVVAAALVTVSTAVVSRASAALDAPCHGQVAAPTPLVHAHSHNDEWRETPLCAALDHGFTSVEADVYLSGGTLHIGHDPSQDYGSFAGVYLDGLRTWVTEHGGTVFPGYHSELQLVVEIKDENPLPAYETLNNELGNYADLLSRRDKSGTGWTITHGLVQVVLTGAAVTDLRERMADESSGLTFIEGDLANVNGYDPTRPADNPAFMPELLANWQTIGNLPGLVRDAHTKGYRVRVWNQPDPPRCPEQRAPCSTDSDLARFTRTVTWWVLSQDKVDYISSNHLGYLADWLAANYNS